MRRFFACAVTLLMTAVAFSQIGGPPPPPPTAAPAPPKITSFYGVLSNQPGPPSYQQFVPAVQIDSSKNYGFMTLYLTLYEWDDDIGEITLGAYEITLDENGSASWCLDDPEDPLLKGAYRSDQLQWIPHTRFAQVRCLLWKSYWDGSDKIYDDPGYKTFELQE